MYLFDEVSEVGFEGFMAALLNLILSVKALMHHG